MFFFSFFRKTFFFPAAVAFAIFLSCQSLFLARRFLLRDRRAARAFACARVGVGSLSAHRQPATMTQSAIGADVHQTLDVHLHALAQVAFNFALLLDYRTNATQVFLAEIL